MHKNVKISKASCSISAWGCVYHACMSNHCQKRHVLDNGVNWGAGKCEGNGISKLKLIILVLIMSSVSCVKDDEPAITSGIEGTYEGISILDCPGFGYYKQRANTIEITAFDGERINISTMRTNAKANVNQNRYNYVEFYWIGTSDCGRDMYVMYTQGSGQFKGDSLIENGQAQVNGYPATWKTRSIKIK